MIAILAIDSGIKGAWALFHPYADRPWAYGEWKGLDEDGLDQAHEIAIQIDCALHSPLPVSRTGEARAITGLLIVHEVPAGKARTNGHITFRPAHWLVGMLRARLDGWLSIEVREVIPSIWQGSYCIGGRMGRVERKRASVEMCRRIWRIDAKADQADALLMGEWMRGQMRTQMQLEGRVR